MASHVMVWRIISVISLLCVAPRHVIAQDGVCTTMFGRPGRCMSLLDCGATWVNTLLLGERYNVLDSRYIRNYPVFCYFPMLCCETFEASSRHIVPIAIDEEVTRSVEILDQLVHLNDERLSRLPLNICGVSTQEFIVNGKRASLGQFPWIVLLCSVSDDGSETCTCAGTLISDRFIVTAAHCVGNTSSSTFTPNIVVLGEENRNTNPDCNPDGRCAPSMQRILVENVIVHPGYNPRVSKQNDIALIKIAAPANLTQGNVCPICLPIGNIQFKDLQTVPELIVAGWGSTDQGAQSGMSRVLMFAGVREVPQLACSIAHGLDGQAIGPSQICVTKEAQGSCRGDSGGPLMLVDAVPWTTDETRAILVGIVSFGPVPCVNPIQPAVYTRVGHFVSWILDNMKPKVNGTV